jgi:N-ethylmaleimide reductase
MEKLLSKYTLGNIELKNRVAMAPMTRSRSIGNIPGELVAQYYGQRAEAGLLITEGVSPSPNGLGYARIPGAFSAEQAAGWKQVAAAVHKNDSRIFMQIMHTGRVGHPLNLPEGGRIVGASAIAAPGEMYTDLEGLQPHPVPAEMTDGEVWDTVAEYAQAAANVIENSDFDGVELHGANGYLIDQFLNTASNLRTDQWGKTIEGRAKFALEVAKATVAKAGKERVGIRISPYGAFNGSVPDDEMDALYIYLAKELGALGIAYIHMVDHSSMGTPPVPDKLKQKIKEAFGGTFILSGGYSAAQAESDLLANKGDLVAFGRPFISNPKLVTAFKTGKDLLDADQDTFYTPGPEGYTDYPV